MKVGLLISFLIPLLVGLAIWFAARPGDELQIESAKISSIFLTLPTEGQTEVKPSSTKKSETEPPAESSSKTSRPADESTRLQDEYNQTGRVPKKILDWSTDLARRMVQVGNDPEKALNTFDWLKKCFEDDHSVEPVKALCAANAKKLSTKFPEALSQKYNQMEREFSPKLKTFIDQVTP